MEAASSRATNELESYKLQSTRRAFRKFKAWLHQHGIIFIIIILWPVLVYQFPISTREGFERVSTMVVRLANTPEQSKLTLPINSVRKEFVVNHSKQNASYWDAKSISPIQ